MVCTFVTLLMKVCVKYPFLCDKEGGGLILGQNCMTSFINVHLPGSKARIQRKQRRTDYTCSENENQIVKFQFFPLI